MTATEGAARAFVEQLEEWQPPEEVIEDHHLLKEEIWEGLLQRLIAPSRKRIAAELPRYISGKITNETLLGLHYNGFIHASGANRVCNSQVPKGKEKHIPHDTFNAVRKYLFVLGLLTKQEIARLALEQPRFPTPQGTKKNIHSQQVVDWDYFDTVTYTSSVRSTAKAALQAKVKEYLGLEEIRDCTHGFLQELYGDASVVSLAKMSLGKKGSIGKHVFYALQKYLFELGLINVDDVALKMMGGEQGIILLRKTVSEFLAAR